MNDQLLSEIKRLVISGDHHADHGRFSASLRDNHVVILPAKKQKKRISYAADPKFNISLPGPDENAIRFGRAELPVGARVTEHDKKIARKAPPIPEPRSRDDVPRYIAQLGADDLFM